MASYIGVIVRTTVPIIVESWPKVEKDLKNEIWKSVEMAFVLAPRCRKMVLSSATNKWRQFKSELTTKYVLPYKDQPDALKDPPEEYDFIKQQDWEQFVKSRLTTDFQHAYNPHEEYADVESTLRSHLESFLETARSFNMIYTKEIRPWTHMMEVPQLHGFGPAANRLLEAYKMLLKKPIDDNVEKKKKRKEIGEER